MEASKTMPGTPVVFRTSGSPFERAIAGYKPIISNRTTLVNRTSLVDFLPTSTMMNRRSQRLSTPVNMPIVGMRAGAVVQASNDSLSTFKEGRDKEKKDMNQLNDRLASYIEKVRFLEAKNMTLKTEVDNLTKDKGNEVLKIKDMFLGELNQARALIEELTEQKAEADVMNMKLEDLLAIAEREHENDVAVFEEWKQSYEDMAKKVRGYETNISALTTRAETQDRDLKKERDLVTRLQEDNARLRMDLDSETLNHIKMASKVQALDEEMSFMAAVYDQELKELKAIAQRDVTGDMKDYWKGELSKALNEIQGEYERRLEQIRTELDNNYTQKLRNIRQGATKDAVDGSLSKDELKRLRGKVLELTSKLTDTDAKNVQLESQNKNLSTQMNDRDQIYEKDVANLSDHNEKIRDELDGVHGELKVISDAKLNLELEMTAYRALLDGEEKRITNPNDENGEIQVTQSTGRVTLQRSSRGPMCFTDVSPDGRYISIENSGSGKMAKVINLKDWKIERTLSDSKPSVSYTFGDVTLAPGETIKIWSKCAEDGSGVDDAGELTGDMYTWGTGDSTTYLHDSDEHEKANAVLKFVM